MLLSPEPLEDRIMNYNSVLPESLERKEHHSVQAAQKL